MFYLEAFVHIFLKFHQHTEVDKLTNAFRHPPDTTAANQEESSL